ncbi:MAG: alpha/beta hydrolase [Patescibacteria group bacterium]
MNIIVDDLLTNYELNGKGKLVLLLHGWGDSAKGLSTLASQLSQQYTVLALDLPGFGASQPPKDVWDLDNYSSFLNKLLDKVDLGQPYAVIGHSNGGALALRATSLGNLKPERLVLLAASGVRTGGGGKRLFVKLLAKTGNIATIWMPERYRQGLRKSLYGAAGSDMLVAPGLEETFKKTVRQDVQADAANINIPSLLIYGRDDKAVPLADGEKYHSLMGNSKLVILDEAEHFVHIDKPTEVFNLIEEFLQ